MSISSLKRLTESFGELTLSIAENKIYCEHLKKLFEYLDIDASNENNVDILENVQKGTHDELVANKQGKYYELWNAQAQYYRNSSR